jgi:hypothetical protein
MPNNTFQEYASKKAFEISYALFRISANLPAHRQFMEHLENQAMGLLESVISADYPKTRNILSVIEHFIRLGAETNVIQPATGEIVINEIKVLDSAIAEFGNSAILPNVDLKGVFSQKKFMPEPNNIKKAEKNKYSIPIKQAIENKIIPAIISRDSAIPKDSAIPQNSAISNNSAIPNNSAILQDSATIAEYSIKERKEKERKETILEKIQQAGTCRLRDLQEFLPDLSERTIRYTLQTLVEQGVIERIGSTGPATYYRAKGEFPIDSGQELSTYL